MKKIFISVVLILLVCTSSVFAERSWNVSLSAGYDHQSCNDNSVNAFGVTFGARTPFKNDIDFYADISVHAWGNYKFVTESTIENLPRDNVGFKSHLGFLFDIPVKKENFDLGIGAGAAFARSVASKDFGTANKRFGFTNLGLAIMGIGRYKLNEKISIIGECIPDIYVFNWDTENVDSETKTKQALKIGVGMSAKLGISYSL